MVHPVITLLIPEAPVVVAEVADPLMEKGTIVVTERLPGTVNVQLLNWLLSALFQR